MSEKKNNTKRKKPPKPLPTHITYLEMTAPLLRMPPVPTKPRIALIHAQNIQTHFYRYMYELVGKPHHWEERRATPEKALFHIINGPCTDISILYADGCPAGFFELDLEQKPKSIALKYMGLAKCYQGLGLGKWFCGAAISAAWAHKPEKVSVETNTLDHPAALRLYQRLGFSPVAVADAEITPWE
ncbi:MAG: GNAT family N-acetyltransferase [Pseudomonadota bacterium]